MYYQIHLYSICRGGYRKIYSGTIRVCEGSVWEFQPEMSEPGTIPDMPDYLDILLCKKDGSIFYKMDIERRAINIPLDFQMEGLVLEISITNCDGTKYKKIHHFVRRETTKNQIEPDEDGLQELRPQIDFHKFLK